MKKLMNLTISILVSLSLGLFTGCGGGGGESKPVTTVQCTNTAFTQNNGVTWQVSQTDATVCTPLSTQLNNGNCNSNQIIARVPVNSINPVSSGNSINCPVDNNGIRRCTGQIVGSPGYNNNPGYNSYSNGYNAQFGFSAGYNVGTHSNSSNHALNSSFDPNYHTVSGSYSVTCFDINSSELTYFQYHQGGYYYLYDYNRFQNDFYASYRYHNNFNGVVGDLGIGIVGLAIGFGLGAIIFN